MERQQAPRAESRFRIKRASSGCLVGRDVLLCELCSSPIQQRGLISFSCFYPSLEGTAVLSLVQFIQSSFNDWKFGQEWP